MTNGEYFVLTHPDVKVKENGTCVWIFNLDNTACNHYTMSMEWWNEEMVDIRPKGKWIMVNPLQEDDGGAFMCSCCKVGSWNYDNSYHFYPNCGARMEEDK